MSTNGRSGLLIFPGTYIYQKIKIVSQIEVLIDYGTIFTDPVSGTRMTEPSFIFSSFSALSADS